MPPEVLFCDNHLLLLNKPAGVPTQTHASLSQQSLEEWGKAWIKKEYKKPFSVFLTPVHRLDRPASGIVLFARTSKALERLNALMRERKIIKTYRAYVEGELPNEEGELEHYLIHEEFCARIASKDHPKAKKALLHYRRIDTLKDKTLLEITLHTGRYHQIRAQLSAIGCPIVGDIKYGAQAPLPNGAIELQHFRLAFPHPISQAWFEFALKGC